MSRSDLIPYAILLLRLALGALFLAHGSLKLFVFKPSGTAGYFRSLGLPGSVGYLTIAVPITLSYDLNFVLLSIFNL